MRAVVQRVAQAGVSVAGRDVSAIGPGLLVLLGVAAGDGPDDVEYLVDKLYHLRVFSDAAGKLNLSAGDVGAEILLVSQFTLYGDCRKGRRPSFTAAACADLARTLYEEVAKGLRDRGLTVQTGVFGAEMQVSLVNDGPVTLLLDSKGMF